MLIIAPALKYIGSGVFGQRLENNMAWLAKSMKEGWILNDTEKVAAWNDFIWAMKYCSAKMFGENEDVLSVCSSRDDLEPSEVAEILAEDVAAISQKLSSQVSSIFFSKSALMKAGAREVEIGFTKDEKYLEVTLEAKYPDFLLTEFDSDDLDSVINMASSKLDWIAFYGAGNFMEPLGLMNAAGAKKHKFEELEDDTHKKVLERFLATNPNAEKPGWIIGAGAWDKLAKSHEEMEQGTLEGIPCFKADWSMLHFSDENRMNDIFLGDWADFQVKLGNVWNLTYEKEPGDQMVVSLLLLIDFSRDPRKHTAGRQLSKAKTQG
jgi:hypothetical protein